jgi:hypothetical protein
VRNVLGDSFNAAVHENPFTLARNVLKGAEGAPRARPLREGLRIFERSSPRASARSSSPPSRRHALGTTKTEIPAMQAALLAEKMGVIRQGRFLELIEEGGKRPRGTHAWQNAVKRVEDSVRMTTFMGSSAARAQAARGRRQRLQDPLRLRRSDRLREEPCGG